MYQRRGWRWRPAALLGVAALCVVCVAPMPARGMPNERRLWLRDAAKEMFYHGWNNYMKYAFPKDELNPILCNGRGSDKKNPSNININDALGDYSLTLVDTLDTLAILGDQAEFERAVRLTIATVHFDLDSRVQVFEANIRMLGGLLSAHLLATDRTLGYFIKDYNGELLDMAQDLAKRLMPAFQLSRTGIPYPRVNLRYGVPKTETVETCAAGAGSLILEFGVLSRLTNTSIYEDAAKRSLHAIWDRRSALGLVGNVINLQTGQWIHTASSTGAGIDSFFEYMLKAYVLFGEDEYLDMFREAYGSIMKYIRDPTGYLYRNVHMTNGGLMSSWVDSLSAYFVGLQVLAGDLDSAIKSHLFYYNIWRKYRSLPERFDFYLRSVNIATYPLRPEFVESTYFLYRATRDPFYLRVGEMILEDLNNTTRVACGFATVGDVIGRKLEDRMESFALSETFKYLFLLFDVDHPVNTLDSNFVFTTEGHILPLPRQYLHSKRHRPVPFYSDDNDALTEISAFLPSPNSCPVYQPGQTPSRHHHYHRRAHPQKLSHTNIGLTPLTAFSRPTYPSSSSPYTATTSTTFSHHAHSAILSRPDADFARELVGLDDDHIPPLDPRGYCEAPNLLPQTVELTFGYPAGTTSNGNNQAGQQGHAQQQAADTQDVGWSPTVVKFLGGLVATTLAGLKVELTKRSSRQGAGYDVTKVDDFRLHLGEVLKVNSKTMRAYITDPPYDPEASHTDAQFYSDETALLRVFTRNLDQHHDYVVSTSQFGPRISRAHQGSQTVEGPLYHFPFSSPESFGCDLYTRDQVGLVADHVLIVRRGKCTFARKIRYAQAAGAWGVIFVNTENQIFHAAWPKAGDEEDKREEDDVGPITRSKVIIPSVMVTQKTGDELVRRVAAWEHGMCIQGLPRVGDTYNGLMVGLVPDPEELARQMTEKPIRLSEEVKFEEGAAVGKKATVKLTINGHVIHNIDLVDGD